MRTFQIHKQKPIMSTHTPHTPAPASPTHTPGKLTADKSGRLYAENDPESVACAFSHNRSSDESKANAARLAACWNACTGIPSDKLALAPMDAADIHTRKAWAAIERQNAEIKALRDALADISHGFIVDTGENGLGAVRLDMDAMQAIATAALAKINA